MSVVTAHCARGAWRRASAIGIAALVAAAAAIAAEPPAEWDGLPRIPSKRIELVYARPGASLAGYKRVRLDTVRVSFDKNWNPNSGSVSLSNKLTSTDLEAIKTSLAAEFRKVFKEELAKGGYVLVDANGSDVLLVNAEIMDLYITAPTKPSPGRGRSYVTNAGRMTLMAELRDSTSGQILARVADRQQAGGSGNLEFSNRQFNGIEARTIIGKWASALRQGLDEISDKPKVN